jgi:CHAT domain
MPDHNPQPRPIKILFFSANPDGTETLKTSDEFLAVYKLLQNDSHFVVKVGNGQTAETLRADLEHERPDILHFSGHGVDGVGHIVLASAKGAPAPLPLDTLAKVIQTTRRGNPDFPLRIVVLNACWTFERVDNLRQEVDAVIGMKSSIGDDSAHAFAKGLYGGFQQGFSLPDAMERGKNTITLKNLSDDQIPTFVVRQGIDPHSIMIKQGILRVSELLTWGDEPESDLNEPTEPLSDEIVDKLLGLYPREKGRIIAEKKKRINQGLSGASVYVVTIRLDQLREHSAFAKIDHHARIMRESKIHKKVKESAIAKFVPDLLCEPLVHESGWSLALYQTAAETLLFARSLEDVLTSQYGTLEQKRAPLKRLLAEALDKWHANMRRVETTDAKDEQNWVPTLLEKMLNLGGKNRLGDALSDRARNMASVDKAIQPYCSVGTKKYSRIQLTTS